MEAAPKTRPGPTADDRELAIKLGSMFLFLFGGRADQVIRVIDESGLSFIQMKVLVVLETAVGDVSTVTGLSESLGVSPASASRAVDGLVKKGLASRIEDAEDRRVRRLTLTAKGNALAERIISARMAGLEEFAASLSPAERTKLDSALAVLLERDEIAEIHRKNERRSRR